MPGPPLFFVTGFSICMSDGSALREPGSLSLVSYKGGVSKSIGVSEAVQPSKQSNPATGPELDIKASPAACDGIRKPSANSTAS